MAQTTRILLTNDLDGSEATETITFALDGVTYEIDLNGPHAEQLRECVSAYVTSARRLSSRRTPTTRRTAAKPTGDRPDTQQVRDWAKAQGITVSERGRLSNQGSGKVRERGPRQARHAGSSRPRRLLPTRS